MRHVTPLPVHPFLVSLLRDPNPGDPPALHDEAAWDLVLKEAAEQRLTFILHRWLRNSGMASEFPQALLDDVRQTVFALTAQNLLYAQELASILRAFESGHVDCAPLRGLALAEQLYGDITGRPMEDLDLLVKRESLPKVVEILQCLGFNQIDVRQGFARDYYYAFEFEKKRREGFVMVEPHWSIAYPPFVDRIDMDGVWKRSSQGRVVGVPTRVLSREDLLLHLCYHLMHWHEQAPLLWYFELDRLIRQDISSLDWAQVVCSARRCGQELLLMRVLETLESLFSTPIPDHVLSRLASSESFPSEGSALGFLERRVVELLAGGSRLRGREQFAYLFAVKGLRTKFRYALSLLFPSPAFMRFRYGQANTFQLFYRYCVRSFQLFSEGGRWLVDLLFAPPKHHQS